MDALCRHVYINPAVESKDRNFGLIDPIDLMIKMKAIIGDYKSCKPLKSGSLLVEVNEFSQVKLLLKLKKKLSLMLLLN